MRCRNLSNAIKSDLASLCAGSLSFWGNWFGRPYDNIHRIVGAHAIDKTTIIYFDQAECLVVEAPSDWSLTDGKLLIGNARLVRFHWYYYGRIPCQNTLQFEEYRVSEEGLSFSTNFQAGRQPSLVSDAPAVQLHTLA